MGSITQIYLENGNIKDHKTIGNSSGYDSTRPGIRSFAITQDSKHMFVGSDLGDLCLWNILGECTEFIFGRVHEGSIVKMAFRDNGKTLVTCSHDQTVKQWDVEKLKMSFCMGKCLEDMIIDMAISPNGRQD